MCEWCDLFADTDVDDPVYGYADWLPPVSLWFEYGCPESAAEQANTVLAEKPDA